MMKKAIRFGLDISDHSIEIVGLSATSGRVTVEWAGRTQVPAGVIRRGQILDEVRLAKQLQALFTSVFGERHGPLQAALALPNTQVFSKVFSFPPNLELENAVKAAQVEANDIFPVPLDSLSISAVPVPGTKEAQQIMLAGVDRRVVRSYMRVVNRAGAEVSFLEAESVAACRTLVGQSPDPVLVVDIGASVTGLFVHERGAVRLATAVPVGGDSLTSALEIKLNISLAKAEKLKRREGFSTDGAAGRAFLVLQQPMADIIEEISRTLRYSASHIGREIKRLILIGGNSLIPGIDEYIASNLPGVSVELGSPFDGFDLTPEQQAVGKQRILYTTATGVARRQVGLSRGQQLNFLIKDKSQRSGVRSILGIAGKVGQALSRMVQKKPKSGAKAKAKAKPAKKPAAPKKKAPAKKPAAPKKKAPAKKKTKAEKGLATEAVAEQQSAAPVELAEKPEDVVPGGEAPAESAAPVEPMVDLESEDTVDDDFAQADQEERNMQLSQILNADESGEEAGPDLGQGVGDVLHGTEESGEPPVVPPGEEGGLEDFAEGLGGKPAGERMTVDTILARAKQFEEDYEEEAPQHSGRGRLVALFVLVIVLAVATAAGVYMLMKKNGVNLASSLSFLHIGQKQEQPVEDQAAPTGPKAPTSVAVTALLGTEEQPAGEKPFVLTRTVETVLEKEDSFESTGQATTTAGKSAGTIKVINNTDQDYTFVATTRFITDEGILFRMDEASDIPANGSVEVAVTADKAGAEYDIGPSTFTIPGLSASLQEEIWGESETAMSGGAGLAKAVAEADLSKAKADLLEQLKTEAEAELKKLLESDEAILPDLITSDEVSFEGPEAGAVQGTFKAKLQAKFRAMVLPQDEVDQLLVERLVKVLPEGENQANYDLGLPQYTVEAYDTKANLAEVRAEAKISKTAPAAEKNGSVKSE